MIVYLVLYELLFDYSQVPIIKGSANVKEFELLEHCNFWTNYAVYIIEYILEKKWARESIYDIIFLPRWLTSKAYLRRDFLSRRKRL